MSMYINIHTHEFVPSEDIIAIRNIYPFDKFSEVHMSGCYYSMGIHPINIVRENVEQDLAILEQQLNLPQFIAIGETGLDIYVDIDKELQGFVFEQHIKLSEKYEKPLIIHCVRSFEELIRIKKQYKPHMPWIIHGYNANLYILKELQKHNCICSFGKAILQSQSNAVHAIQACNAYPFFLETDSQDLHIRTIYEQASVLLGKDLEDLQNIIKQWFMQLFPEVVILN